MEAPEVILLTGKWPHFPDIINAMDHDIRDHPWFQLGKPQKKVDREQCSGRTIGGKGDRGARQSWPSR